MTKEQAIAMLKAKRECIELNTNGNAELCDRNCGECKLNYEQGNMGEQKIVLDMAIKALEQQTIPLDKIKQAREEIQGESFTAYGEYDNPQSYYEVIEIADVLKILDGLISEVEET